MASIGRACGICHSKASPSVATTGRTGGNLHARCSGCSLWRGVGARADDEVLPVIDDPVAVFLHHEQMHRLLSVSRNPAEPDQDALGAVGGGDDRQSEPNPYGTNGSRNMSTSISIANSTTYRSLKRARWRLSRSYSVAPGGAMPSNRQATSLPQGRLDGRDGLWRRFRSVERRVEEVTQVRSGFGVRNPWLGRAAVGCSQLGNRSRRPGRRRAFGDVDGLVLRADADVGRHVVGIRGSYLGGPGWIRRLDRHGAINLASSVSAEPGEDKVERVRSGGAFTTRSTL